MNKLNTISEDSEYNFENELIELQINYILSYHNNDNSHKLRIFLKDNIDYVTKNNLINLYSYKLIEYNIMIILETFYDLLSKKINIIFNLKIWKEVYINDFFWILPLIEQIEFLIQLKTYFLSIYDCSHGGSVYYIKLMMIFNKDNYNYKHVMDDIKDRLKRTLDLFGSKIFEKLQIPLIKVSELYKLNHTQILKYFKVIFNNIYQLLNEIIELFKQYYKISEEIEEILNVE